MKLPVEQLVMIKWALLQTVEQLESRLIYLKSLRRIESREGGYSEDLYKQIENCELEIKETKELQDLFEKVSSVTVTLKNKPATR